MLSPGRSRHSTPNDAVPGTKPKAARSKHRLAVGDGPPATPDGSPDPATHSGRTPEDLNPLQQQQLNWIAKTDPRLWRAYLLKEGLRYVFRVKGEEGKQALDQWLVWARRSQLPAFVHLAKRVTKHRAAIDANLEHDLSQGLIESTNTKIRLITRIAYGFHGPQPLIALALLALGSHPPQLPGRH
jgi:transposase